MGITARGAWEVGEAPLPRAGPRHPDQAVHRGRRRRHVGRRVRQRHAAVARTSGWSPPSTTATSSSIPTPDPARELRRAQAAVRPAALVLGATTTTQLISAGGGIFAAPPRRSRSSPSARALRHRGAEQLTPADLMRAILTAPGRPALVRRHRHLRQGHEREPRRCRRPRQRCAAHQRRRRARQVVGEGANLGVTQRGRIELALARRRAINTDAIDNSAGVDTSDHEVNIKILLGAVDARGRADARSSATRCWSP